MKRSLMIGLLLISFASVADSECCKYCTKNSKPCGNTCIPKAWECRTKTGCAYAIDEVRPPKSDSYQQGFADGYAAAIDTLANHNTIAIDCLGHGNTLFHAPKPIGQHVGQ
jgi:hypothetical protein